jgi:sigma-B regulation protein RsbQ
MGHVRPPYCNTAAKPYDRAKYSTLQGYVDDVVELGRELGLKDAVFVGHCR